MTNKPTPEAVEPEEFLVARVSQDTRVIGIDHPTEATWDDVLAAHIALRDRLNVRLAEMGKCPFNPSPPIPDDVGGLLVNLSLLTKVLTEQGNTIWLPQIEKAAATIRRLQADKARMAEALRPFASHVGKRGTKITLTWGVDTWTDTLKPDDFYRASELLMPEHIRQALSETE